MPTRAAPRTFPAHAATSSDLDRFWSKVAKLDACWEWTGSRTPAGYGSYWLHGSLWPAHRAAYEFEVGRISKGLQIDHLCRNRACVNPDHLEPVTQRENILRGVATSAIHARQTACVNGHPFDESNTHINYRSRGQERACRACGRARNSAPVTCPDCGVTTGKTHLRRHQQSSRCTPRIHAEDGADQ